jgi:hypothetical protein
MNATTSITPVSFWNKREGTTGKLGLGLIILAAAVGLYIFGPILITLLETTLTIIYLLVALAFTISILTSKRVHILYKLLCRSITAMFVAVDPIGVKKEQIAEFERKQQAAQERIKDVRGQQAIVDKTIEQTKTAIQENEAIARKAKEKQDMSSATMYMSIAQEKKDSLGRFAKMKSMIELALSKLRYIDELADKHIVRLKESVRTAEIEHNVLGSAAKALKKYAQVFGRGGGDMEIYNMAEEALMQQDAANIASIDEDLRLIERVTKTMDFQQAIYDERALAELEKTPQSPQPSTGDPNNTTAVNYSFKNKLKVNV